MRRAPAAVYRRLLKAGGRLPAGYKPVGWRPAAIINQRPFTGGYKPAAGTRLPEKPTGSIRKKGG